MESGGVLARPAPGGGACPPRVRVSSGVRVRALHFRPSFPMRRGGSLFAMVFTVLVCTMRACALDSSDEDFSDVQDHGELPSPRPLPAAASVAAAAAAAAGQAAAARVARAARAAHAANAAWYCTPEQAAAAAAGSGGGGTFVDLEPQDAARGRAPGMFEEDAPGYRARPRKLPREPTEHEI